LKNPALEIIANTEGLEVEDFTKEGRVRKESIVLTKQFRSDTPAFFNALVDLVEIEDETTYWIKSGIPDSVFFTSIKMGGM
jgi:hypothetical protein